MSFREAWSLVRMSKLYIVATPIGNLGDISFRAIETLKSVDVVLCEDTRVTRKLLNHFDIKVSVESFHEHSDARKLEKIFRILESGKNVAFVTDAGTPGISDPGARLVRHIRTNMPNVGIVPIPGPSAVITALSVSGLPTDQFLFLGFLPHKKGRETMIKKIAESEYTTVVYESPHRILKLLTAFSKIIPDRQMVIARELTKMFEEVKSGTPNGLLAYYAKNPDRVRGEFVVIVSKT